MTSELQSQRARPEGALRRVRVLIVGGGATGQVYGYHLAQSGADVCYYLKPRHAAEAEEGFTLHPFGLVGRRQSRQFSGFEVLTRPEEVRSRQFDQVWLCISGPALRSGVVESLVPVCPDAVWVCLQPGLAARAFMLQHVPEERLVMGMISLVAYQAPLPDEDRWPEGIAYWLPPASPTLFSGPRAESIANSLQAGGLGAAVKKDVEIPATFGSGALIPFVIALESARWSFETMRRSKVSVERLCGAITEIFAAVEADRGTGPGGIGILRKPLAWKLALFAAPQLAPFPLRTYLEYHFTKLRAQSEEVISEFRSLCAKHGVDAPNLAVLEETWFENRAPIESGDAGKQKLVAAAEGTDLGLIADSEPTPPPESLETPSVARATVPDLPSLMKKELQAAVAAAAAEAQLEASQNELVESVEVEPEEVESAEVEPAEVESAEVESAEVESSEVESAEVESSEVESSEVESSEVESSEVESSEVESSEVESEPGTPAVDAPKPKLDLGKLKAKLAVRRAEELRAKEAEKSTASEESLED